MRKNNRERILETARSLLPRYGYSGISIRAIAFRARLTTGAIYFHFKNKRDIYKTICYEAIDLMVTRMREGIAGRSTPNQKLISIYDTYMEFFYRHRDYYNIIMEYKAHYGTEGSGSDEIAQKLTELTRVTEETISLGIREKRIRELNPLMLSVFLAAVTEGMLQYKKLGLLDALKISDDQFRSFMAEIVDIGIHS